MTFAREFMGLFVLGVFWLNALLTCAYALERWVALGRLSRSLDVVRGYFRAAAPGGEPEYRLAQGARTRGDGLIHFHDRRVECSLGPGTLRTEAGDLALSASPRGVWVWPDLDEVRRQSGCPDAAAYRELERGALTARGVERVISVHFAPDELSYVAGGSATDGGRHGTPERPLVVSRQDPSPWFRQSRARLLRGVLGILATSGGLTAVCFVPPVFGPVSTGGAFALLVYFFVLQGIGAKLDERARPVHLQEHGGVWRRAATEPATATAGHAATDQGQPKRSGRPGVSSAA